MSRIKIWEEGIEPKEGDILLRLLPIEFFDFGRFPKKGIRLCAVDRDGKKVIDGNLLLFTDWYGLSFAKGVNKSIGFSLDAHGELEIDHPLQEIKKDEDKVGEEESLIKRLLKNLRIKAISEEIKKLEEKKKELESL